MKHVNDDILNVTTGIILHGVNCQGAMGSGVAGALRRAYPQVYDDYADYLHANPVESSNHHLGNIVVTEINKNLLVISGFTQDHFGGDGRAYANIRSVREVIWRAVAISALTDLPLNMVPIGSGLGGLDIEEVYKSIEYVEQEIGKRISNFGSKFEINVYDIGK